MNRYLAISFFLFTAFLILVAFVSPRINPKAVETPIVKADETAFLQINESHYKPFDQLMVLLTLYGREVVWTLAAILLVIFGGWAGRKAAIVMAIAMIVLIPIGILAKEVVGRSRPIT